MTVVPGSFDIGPATGRLLVRTGRAGVAAKVGHDLTITFEQWSGRLVLDGDSLESASVEATVEMESIRILEGSGGALPLTDRDRGEIRKTALRLLETRRHPTATYASSGIERRGDSASIAGTLTVLGRSTPVRIGIAPNGTGWRGTATVRQSSFGILPYRAFLGALRLADEVRIEVELTVADGAGE